MKTLKALRISSVFQAVYCFFCVLSSVLFLIYKSTDMDILVGLGVLAMYGWSINPVGPVTLAVGMVLFSGERKDPVQKERIGKKWLWFIAWFVIDTVLWVLAGGLMVGITGGV